MFYAFTIAIAAMPARDVDERYDIEAIPVISGVDDDGAMAAMLMLLPYADALLSRGAIYVDMSATRSYIADAVIRYADC